MCWVGFYLKLFIIYYCLGGIEDIRVEEDVFMDELVDEEWVESEEKGVYVRKSEIKKTSEKEDIISKEEMEGIPDEEENIVINSSTDITIKEVVFEDNLIEDDISKDFDAEQNLKEEAIKEMKLLLMASPIKDRYKYFRSKGIFKDGEYPIFE